MFVSGHVAKAAYGQERKLRQAQIRNTFVPRSRCLGRYVPLERKRFSQPLFLPIHQLQVTLSWFYAISNVGSYCSGGPFRSTRTSFPSP